MHRGTPEKLGDLDIIIYSSVYHPVRMWDVGDLGQVTMETRPAAIEKPAHMCAMCTGPFLLFNSGYEARLAATCVQVLWL